MTQLGLTEAHFRFMKPDKSGNGAIKGGFSFPLSIILAIESTMKTSPLLVVALAFVIVAFTEAKPAELIEKDGEGAGMSDALKYLEELDKYYSQVARPRYVHSRPTCNICS